MKINIKRIDKSLELPVYETNGAAGFDILARTDVRVEAGAIELVPGNIVVEVPEGYMLAVASRSSTPRKKGLSTPHGFGVIDSDYCGPNDEIKIQVYNFTSEAVEIKRGEKIAQGVFIRVDTFAWNEVDEMGGVDRGGFGSTDREHGGVGGLKKAKVKKERVVTPVASAKVVSEGIYGWLKD